MTTFTAKPVVQTTVTTYPSGKSTISFANVSTSEISTQWKVTDKDPPYKANLFLIKDYEVGQTTFAAEDLKLELPTFVRSDGVKFKTSLAGPLNNIARSITKIDQSYVDLSALKRLAVQEAHGKLIGVEWDLGVDLAELRETADLLPSLFKKAKRGIDKAQEARDRWASLTLKQKRRDKSHEDTAEALEELGEDASSIWLLNRYGVMPILYSIQDALELMKKQLQRISNRICTARRRMSKTVNETKKHRDSSGLYTVVQYHHECRVEGIVYYKRVMDQSMQQALGLLPERIPSVAWELTRLSFVWDWFFNVGSFLDYLQPKFDVVILGSSYSEKQIAAHAVMTEYKTVQGNLTKSCSDTAFHRQRFKRTANPSDIGQMAFTGLHGLNLEREIDAAALAFKPLLKAAKALFRK